MNRRDRTYYYQSDYNDEYVEEDEYDIYQAPEQLVEVDVIRGRSRVTSETVSSPVTVTKVRETPYVEKEITQKQEVITSRVQPKQVITRIEPRVSKVEEKVFVGDFCAPKKLSNTYSRRSALYTSNVPESISMSDLLEDRQVETENCLVDGDFIDLDSTPVWVASTIWNPVHAPSAKIIKFSNTKAAADKIISDKNGFVNSERNYRDSDYSILVGNTLNGQPNKILYQFPHKDYYDNVKNRIEGYIQSAPKVVIV